MAIVWLLKLRGHTQVTRVYGPDLMLAVCEHGIERGYRHYFYGGAPGVAEQLAQVLSERFRGLIISGIESPPFRELTRSEDDEAVKRIRSAQPDIVWVGIGSPGKKNGCSLISKDWGFLHWLELVQLLIFFRAGSLRLHGGCSTVAWSGYSAWRASRSAYGNAMFSAIPICLACNE